jgi:hypothetical protein
MTSQEVDKQIRQSLGLPPKPEPAPTMPQEGHVCDFPIWSYSKKRSTVTTLRIDYKGLPGISSPGYLDVLVLGVSCQALVAVFLR